MFERIVPKTQPDGDAPIPLTPEQLKASIDALKRLPEDNARAAAVAEELRKSFVSPVEGDIRVAALNKIIAAPATAVEELAAEVEGTKQQLQAGMQPNEAQAAQAPTREKSVAVEFPTFRISIRPGANLETDEQLTDNKLLNYLETQTKIPAVVVNEMASEIQRSKYGVVRLKDLFDLLPDNKKAELITVCTTWAEVTKAATMGEQMVFFKPSEGKRSLVFFSKDDPTVVYQIKSLRGQPSQGPTQLSTNPQAGEGKEYFMDFQVKVLKRDELLDGLRAQAAEAELSEGQPGTIKEIHEKWSESGIRISFPKETKGKEGAKITTETLVVSDPPTYREEILVNGVLQKGRSINLDRITVVVTQKTTFKNGSVHFAPMYIFGMFNGQMRAISTHDIRGAFNYFAKIYQSEHQSAQLKAEAGAWWAFFSGSEYAYTVQRLQLEGELEEQKKVINPRQQLFERQVAERERVAANQQLDLIIAKTVLARTSNELSAFTGNADEWKTHIKTARPGLTDEISELVKLQFSEARSRIPAAVIGVNPKEWIIGRLDPATDQSGTEKIVPLSMNPALSREHVVIARKGPEFSVRTIKDNSARLIRGTTSIELSRGGVPVVEGDVIQLGRSGEPIVEYVFSQNCLLEKKDYELITDLTVPERVVKAIENAPIDFKK